jgi:hypothetical protein
MRRTELLSWAAGLGVVSAEALAAREGQPRGDSARARLAAAERAGLMRGWRLLSGAPPLYTLTREGLRASGRGDLKLSRVSPAGATHAAACCRVAVLLESAFPGHRAAGEPEICSAFAHLCPPVPGRHGPRFHRPDLLLVPASFPAAAAIAVEVELTVKAPDRLESICRAWARQRTVDVLYLAPEPVRRPLESAVQRAGARGRIVIVAL